MVGGGQVRLRGTSPRTRGKQDDSQVCDLHARNIPAHAGKTVDENGNLESIQEHPRARGENPHCHVVKRDVHGTSPRTRGKQCCSYHGQNHLRNIPAHAGKTRNASRKPAVKSEHPRARGENHVSNLIRQLVQGTSPRTRGKLILTCGSSFLKVILHSVLFSHIMGV